MKWMIGALVAFALAGCTTTSGVIDRPSYDVEDDAIRVTVVPNNSRWVTLRIANKTDGVVSFIPDNSSFSYSGGLTTRIVPEGTLGQDATRSLPPVSIPPRGVYARSFAAADAVYFARIGSHSSWQIRAWIPNDTRGTSFVIG